MSETTLARSPAPSALPDSIARSTALLEACKRKNPSLPVLKRLAKALGVKLRALVE